MRNYQRPYSKLALVYDAVMEHVDYDQWSNHVRELIERFHPDAKKLLELGCGTGELSARLAENFDWTICSTDVSPEMVQAAKAKFGSLRNILFETGDFLETQDKGMFDVLVLIHDGLNYCLEESEIIKLFHSAKTSMKEDSIFIFDQSTPRNSLNNLDFFEDEGEQEGIFYERTSKYDSSTRYHENHFIIYQNAEAFEELHVQKAYTKAEIALLIDQAGLEELGSFGSFTFEEATEESERIHWVVKKSEE